MPVITDMYAREIIDSRGNPTVEVEVLTTSGAFGRAAIPSGASTGAREALELRDGDKDRFNGKGVLKAVENVNKVIAPKLIGLDVTEQAEIDALLLELDGTKFKSNLGANATLGASLACLKAAADFYAMPLYKYIGGFNAVTIPVPMMNFINGGSHADSSVDFQEYMMMPVGAKNIHQALRMGSEVFHALKSILSAEGHVTAVGDEGGFAPNLEDNEAPIKYILKAVEKAGYKPYEDVVLAMDVAASEFYDEDKKVYNLAKSGGGTRTAEDLINMYAEWVEKYPIISIEDGLAEDDWAGWTELTAKLGEKVQIVGDDLFVTNPEFLAKGIEQKSANSILIKINQIGTMTETLDAMELAKRNGFTCVVSHRSGETADTTIADLAVGFNAGQIKTGSISRTDRVAKYNQLLRISDELGDAAKFDGMSTFYNIKK